MTLDRDEAAASLSDIASVERRTREAVVYAQQHHTRPLGRALRPRICLPVFPPARGAAGVDCLGILGFVGTFVSGHWRRSQHRSTIAQPLLYAQLALVGYGLVLLVLLWPVDPRQLSAFWPTLFMLGFVLMGLWLGRFFILCGLAVTALTLAGYFWSGAWFPLWMAAVNGGGLLAGGLWLRRLR